MGAMKRRLDSVGGGCVSGEESESLLRGRRRCVDVDSLSLTLPPGWCSLLEQEFSHSLTVST